MVVTTVDVVNVSSVTDAHTRCADLANVVSV